MNLSVKILMLTLIYIGSSLNVLAKVPDDKKELVAKIKKERGSKLNSQSVNKKLNQSYELQAEDKVQEAIDVLEAVKAKDKFDIASIQYYLGKYYWRLDKEELAIKAFKKAIKLNQLSYEKHGELVRFFGQYSRQKEKYEDAIKYFKRYLDFSHDEDPKVILSIAHSYYQLKKFDEVISPARKSISLFEETKIDPYLLIMGSYSEREMHKEVVGVLEEVVKLFPTKAKWWAKLGSMYAFTEDYARGVSTLEVAYNKGYLTKKGHIKTLAQLYVHFDVPFKAANLLEKEMGTGLLEKDKDMLKQVASLYLNSREFDKAAKFFGKAARVGQDSKLYQYQGTSYMAIEDFSNAVIAFEEALSLDNKKKGYVYLSLAESQFYLENWQAAYNAAQEALKDKRTAKAAVGWQTYIKEKAGRRGAKLSI